MFARFFVAVALSSLFAVSCAAHAPAADSPSPSPSRTGYLGIERMSRGHLATINRNVLVLWVDPSPGEDFYTTVSRVFEGIEPMLAKSDIQIVVVKVTQSKG